MTFQSIRGTHCGELWATQRWQEGSWQLLQGRFWRAAPYQIPTWHPGSRWKHLASLLFLPENQACLDACIPRRALVLWSLIQMLTWPAVALGDIQQQTMKAEIRGPTGSDFIFTGETNPLGDPEDCSAFWGTQPLTQAKLLCHFPVVPGTPSPSCSPHTWIGTWILLDVTPGVVENSSMTNPDCSCFQILNSVQNIK